MLVTLEADALYDVADMIELVHRIFHLGDDGVVLEDGDGIFFCMKKPSHIFLVERVSFFFKSMQFDDISLNL